MAKKESTEEAKQAQEMVENIATNIAQLSRSVGELLNGRLKRKAIVILLTHTSKLNQWQVERVLDSLQTMEKDYSNK